MPINFKNLSAAFKDAKTRAILIVVVVIIIIGVGIAWLGLKRSEQKAPEAESSVAGTPGISSLPGSATASREYVKLQEQENLQKAQEAAKTGGSALPALSRTTYTGGSEFANAGLSGSPDCSPAALAKARQAGVKAEELRCKGCNAADLRAAGYTAGELMNAGFSAAQLKNAGFTAQELLAAGFSAADLQAAGFTAAELAAAGGVVPTANTPKDCSVEALQNARSQGMSASSLRLMGCSALALKAAGYTAEELKAAGYSAGELKQAGFAVGDIENANYDATQLRDAGFPAEDLTTAFTPTQLKAAGFSDGELIRAGIAITAPQQPAAVAAPSGFVSNTPSSGIVSLPPIAQDSNIAALEALQRRQTEQMSQQERQDRITQLQQTMTQQTGELFASWSPPATQQYQYVSQVIPGQKVATTTTTETAAQTAAAQQAALAAVPIIKAGAIMFGVLDTSLNSDEPGPVLATIVDGPYKGARLVGSFQRENKKVILSFNTMNIPGQPQSIGVNAFAIDPNTARTALATDVDSHYLLRFGTLFASSFITGLSEAISQSGSTTTITLNGITTTNPGLSTAQQGLVALGEVGKQFGNVLTPLFTRAPTVKVDSGVGIGLLFMSDVSLANASPQEPVAGTVPPPPLNAPSMASPSGSGFASSTSSTTYAAPGGGVMSPAAIAAETRAAHSISNGLQGNPPGLPSLMRPSP